MERITSCELLKIKVDRCDTQEYISYIIIITLGALSSRFRKEGAMLMLPQEDRALLRKDESRTHLEWRLRGSAVFNLSKTSGMLIKSFINIYYINFYLFF
jgi:hypothetical protein